MKKMILLAMALLTLISAKAQISALTETGDEVVLYDDGTWKYLHDSTAQEHEIPINETTFTKSKNSSFLVKSKNVNVGVWIHPKNWQFSKVDDASAQEFNFKRRGEDLYAMLITEKMQIPLQNLRTIAIENGRAAAPDIKVVKEEYRTVNGLQVLMMQLGGTIQGIQFRYFGYYFTSEKGTVQLISYTSENLFNEYKEEMEEILNGFVEL